MTVPQGLARLLDGRPAVGAREQAFVFLTVDQAGFPHVALLSRAELAVSPDGRAGLVAVEGTTAHYAKLRVVRTIDAGESIGCAMTLAGYQADTLGIPLSPVSFVTTAGLARLEDWAASDRLLRRLAG